MKHAGGRPRKKIKVPPERLPEQPYFTVPEIIALTGLHEETIQARLMDGTLKGKKLGNRWRVYRESLL